MSESPVPERTAGKYEPGERIFGSLLSILFGAFLTLLAAFEHREPLSIHDHLPFFLICTAGTYYILAYRRS